MSKQGSPARNMAGLVLIVALAAFATVAAVDTDKCFGTNQYYACRVEADKSCTDVKDSTGLAIEDNENEQSSSRNNVTDITKCNAKCFCSPGTARDENNECVPYDQCNQPCDENEAKDYCPADCEADYCPKNDMRSSQCPQPTPCPKPQCKCRFNYRRAENGTCVPTTDCPPFECKNPFEVYDPCPPFCPDGTCSQATPDGQCPATFGFIGIVLECNPGCRCQEGYWWNENNTCVPYSQCPGKGAN